VQAAGGETFQERDQEESQEITGKKRGVMQQREIRGESGDSKTGRIAVGRGGRGQRYRRKARLGQHGRTQDSAE